MTFWVLIGLGPNDVEITSLIFSSKEAALNAITPLLGKPQMAPESGRLEWMAPDWDDDVDVDVRNFYTSYYGGCGDCCTFELRRVTEGRPFCAFNLD